MCYMGTSTAAFSCLLIIFNGELCPFGCAWLQQAMHGRNMQLQQHSCCYLARPCHAGLELFFIDALGAAAGNGPTWAAPSAFFAFGSEEERERAAAVLTGQAALGSSLPGGRLAAAAAGSILEVPLSLGKTYFAY